MAQLEDNSITFSEYLKMLEGRSETFPTVDDGSGRFQFEFEGDNKERVSYDPVYLNDKLIERNENGVIDVEKYVDNLMELRRRYEDKKLPYPDLLSVGQKIKENRLLPEDIYTNPVLMQVIDDHIEARIGPNMIKRLTSIEAGTGVPLEAAKFIKGFRNYDKLDPKNRWEKFQNYMRSWEIGNTYTVVPEVVGGIVATEEERQKIGAGYKLFGLQDNVVTGSGTWKEFGDAMFDYGRSLAFDPINLATFGLSKLVTAPAALGVKKTLNDYFKAVGTATYKQLRARGFTKAEARKKVFRGIANRNLAASTLKYMLPDLAINVAVDLGQQMQLVNVGNQEEIDKYRTALVALTGSALPLTVGTGTIVYRELKNSKLFNKFFLNFEEVNEVVRQSGKSHSKVIEEMIKEPENYAPIIDSIDANFGIIKSDISNLKKWEEAKQASADFLKGKRDTYTQSSSIFFRDFFHGIKDEKGNQITKGYIEALTEAGWVFPKDAVEDGQKATAILANTINWIDDSVIERIVKSHEELTGVSLQLPEYTARALESRYIDVVVGGARTSQITSVAVRGVKVAEEIMGDPLEGYKAFIGDKGDDVITGPEITKFGLSTFKRMLTSHPGTTSTNLKGFMALNLADTAGELNTGIINIFQTGFYKAIGNQDKAAYFSRQAWANLMSAAKRGVSVLDPDLNINIARAILEAEPKVLKKLMRDMSGDGGVINGREIFNLQDSKIAGALDNTSKFFQHLSLMKLQDEYTKLWAFTNNMNKYIMKKYGVSPKLFFSNKNAMVKLNTKEFVDEVLMMAANQTQRQTASVNWSQIVQKEGKNFWLGVAKDVEKYTNATAFGFVVPFGSFANTVAATFGDASGINFLRSVWRDIDGTPNHMITSEQLGKAATGWVYTVYRTLYDPSGNGNSALEKVADGRSYKQNYDNEGNLINSEFDWPVNNAEMVAQVFAHALSGDGRDVIKDLQNLNPAEVADYIFKNINFANVPEDLIVELGVSLGFGAVRDTEKVIKYFSEKLYNATTESGGTAFEEIVGMFADGAARITNGLLRPLEPINVLANVLNGNGGVPDLRQGNQRYNQAFRYVNSLIDITKEAITGEKVDRPLRYTITQGMEDHLRDYSEGKVLFSARRMPANTLGHMMLNSIGLPSYKFSRWDGDPVVKNEMDRLAAPIFETLAKEAFAKYPNFFRGDLKYKRKVVLEEIQGPLRKQVKELIDKYSPKHLSVIKYLSTFNETKLKEIKEKLGEVYDIPDLGNMSFSEILELNSNTYDGLSLLNAMKLEAENYDAINMGSDTLQENLGYR